MVSEAQKRAAKKWDEKNKERVKILRRKADVKNFILKKADAEQIEEIKEWIRQWEENSKE